VPWVLGLVWLVAGCQREKAAPVAVSVPAPRVEFAGCAAVVDGPVCELSSERALRLWVEGPEGTALTVRAGGAALPVDLWTVRGGRAGTVVVPPGASEVAVEVERPEGQGVWRLPVREGVPVPLLQQAKALRAEGKAAEAEKLLREGLSALPPEGLARGTGLLARLRLAQGHPGEAASLLREALALHRAAGLRSDEVHDALVLSYVLIHHGRHFTEARTVLDALVPRAREYPEGAAQLPYYQGLLADESGDMRTLLHLLDDTEARSERLGLERHLRAVRLEKAMTLQYLGRGAEALALLDVLRAGLREDASACERAELLNNIGWGRLLEGEADGHAPQEPLPALEEALTLFRGACPRPESEANVLVNLALADLQAGKPQAAQARLEAARRVRSEPGLRIVLWWLDLEGRIHLESGRARQAVGLYGRLAELAEASLSPEARWRATFGRGRALERLGDVRGALAAYAEAEALLDDEALRVPVAEGRHSFLGERERSGRAYVALAVKAGRVAEALEVARRARVRVLEAVRLSDRLAALSAEERVRWESALSKWRELRAALDEEAEGDWRLSAKKLAEARQARKEREVRLKALLDEALSVLEPARTSTAQRGALARPGPGELRLVYFPGPGGWLGFAEDAGGVVVKALGPVPREASPAVLAGVLLEPFRERIAAAGRVTFAPYGALRAVDFHALPFGGDALVASRPVAYALDLPRRESEPAPPEARAALIVADPQGNLPSARQEARLVHGALEAASGWRVRVQEGTGASAQAVRAALEEASLFHYAGHGRFAGLGGWESALPLHEGQLTVGDVLALRRVPPWVVLSGCETARAEQDSPVESMGLAQAFLAAGSRGVVAAWRVVDDVHSMRLMGALYGHTALADASELPAALRHAQLRLRAEHPSSDWAAFRALVP
jgi:tetratricopeptide (TPR) repeat protein